MDEQRILEELTALLKASNVTIRREPLGGSGGGLCMVKGERIYFLDTEAASADSAAACAEAVSEIVDIDSIYLKPQVRQFIESRTNQIS